jgi:hypothetical protein
LNLAERTESPWHCSLRASTARRDMVCVAAGPGSRTFDKRFVQRLVNAKES